MHNSLTDHLIAPSDVIYKHLTTLPGFDPEKVSLIPDGVDTTRFSPQVNGAGIRREFNIPADAPLVVMVARLERVKGHDYFFKALKILQDQKSVPNLRALCACDERTPGVFEQTVRQARDMGLSEQLLSFTGMRKDVENIVAAANVIALPSLGSEGSTRVGLEAGASGKAVVASRVGCLPEVILDGQTGLIVPPADETALASALGKLLNDRAQAKKLGAAARKRVEANYDESVMVQRLEEVYRTEVAQKRTR
jgi:glycosyltransferase involved in cell wall biosynthesis